MNQLDTEFRPPVTIAITGTHSTGKTTFITRLAEELCRNRIEAAIVGDLGAQALQLGFPILSRHTWASTLWIITRGISNELAAWQRADVVLIDRAIPDALGYYDAALEFSGRQRDPNYDDLEQIVTAHSRNYDLLLRTVLDPSVPLGDNKPRDTDLEFRACADAHVDKVLRRLDIPHDTLTFASHDRAIIEAIAFIDGRLNGVDAPR
ncbi:signal recognition particle subunit FFH/SRP54 (srp54) [Nocardia amikacinitolerans]|uniref:Signal recognition particle subunit FFH/SRP54 (Srp54) n=1 Tax=Nocardia amikacinitolerans TaxID=756689 RepID=A0A285LUK0_9NOCA|nr:AAA family ATPase [Nocardia amikacinitolerans]SNY88143.1 signal recognition particle subunit FFH/SRP54 (srp54) [Nocardia amikacinitolerans]